MTNTDVDAVIVGAGFSGLYATHRLRNLQGLSVQCFDAGVGPGGVWYWNRYPGARCDFESIYYSYTFDADLQREWRWSERFAAQLEIRAYLEHVAAAGPLIAVAPAWVSSAAAVVREAPCRAGLR